MTPHHPRKRFGQHFLHDRNIIAQIVHAMSPKPDEIAIEIGPGQGVLTRELLPHVKELIAIEIDRDLAATLQSHCDFASNLTVINEDILHFNFSELLTTPMRIVGNLPYNISTPLIFKLLLHADNIIDCHFMLQKEVVDRMAAPPGNKQYGRLSVMVQYHCLVTKLFTVPPNAFRPPPKVDSAVVRLKPHTALPHVVTQFNHFQQIVTEAFNHRRKTLRNSLHSLISDELWKKIDIDNRLRPEQLSVADFVILSNSYSQSQGI